MKKTGLQVNVGTSVSWGENIDGESSSSKSDFRVTIPTTNISNFTVTGAIFNVDNGYYEVPDITKMFSLTYNHKGNYMGFPVEYGICDVKRTISSTFFEGANILDGACISPDNYYPVLPILTF